MIQQQRDDTLIARTGESAPIPHAATSHLAYSPEHRYKEKDNTDYTGDHVYTYSHAFPRSTYPRAGHVIMHDAQRPEARDGGYQRRVPKPNP